MPNWSSNSLTTDDPALIAELKKIDGDDGLLGHFVPMPEALRGITSGSCTIDGEQVSLWRRVDGRNVAIPEEELTALRAQHGTASWYDWSVTNWGTKWDAEISSAEPLPDGSYRVCFDTAWSPPVEWAQKVSRQYPDRPLTVAFAEQGVGFYGYVVLHNGEEVGGSETSGSFYRDDLSDEDWNRDTEEILKPEVLDFLNRWSVGTGG